MKYILTNQTIKVKGDVTLHRIVAVKDFGNVKTGDLGGWLQDENNLSQEGNCWIYDNAAVYGNAKVFGDAKLRGNAKIETASDYAGVNGFGTEQHSTNFFRCSDGKVRVACGCFYGTIDEFRKRVKATRNGKVAEEYLLVADLMERHFS